MICSPPRRDSASPRWSSVTRPPSSINNRDLATFETRLETTLELVPSIPPGPIIVSESGFFTGADVRRVVAAGAHAVLIGEALVRAGDIAAKIRELTLREPEVRG